MRISELFFKQTKNYFVHVYPLKFCNINKHVLPFIKTDKIEDNEEIFSLEWSRWEEHSKVFTFGLKTKVTNALDEHLYTIEQIILKYIGKDDFKVLRSLTERFFVEFKAMMSAVFQGCLDFRFNFLSADERMAIMQDLPKVQSILNRMLFPPDFDKDYPGVRITATINHEYTSDGNTQSG